jgi:Domain of unknown function (DUF5664)
MSTSRIIPVTEAPDDIRTKKVGPDGPEVEGINLMGADHPPVYFPETIITDEVTGGKKGEKAQRYDLVPWDQMDKVAELYEAGMKKYAAHNWKKGYAWHLSFSSLVRHATQFWEGESIDQETGCHHLASVVFHALALMYFEEHYPDKDDRPNGDKSVKH